MKELGKLRHNSVAAETAEVEITSTISCCWGSRLPVYILPEKFIQMAGFCKQGVIDEVLVGLHKVIGGFLIMQLYVLSSVCPFNSVLTLCTAHFVICVRRVIYANSVCFMFQ